MIVTEKYSYFHCLENTFTDIDSAKESATLDLMDTNSDDETNYYNEQFISSAFKISNENEKMNIKYLAKAVENTTNTNLVPKIDN